MGDSKVDRGALRIPAADGYHYADDHAWEDSDQETLIGDLDAIEKTFEERAQAGQPALG